MNDARSSAAPFLTALALLLLVSVLYAVSYLVLVVPRGDSVIVNRQGRPLAVITEDHYCVGGDVARTAFWPLEQIDRRLRPGAWKQLIVAD